MKYRRLGRTDLDVSVICLGTMTFGEQNTEADGHAQMDMALDYGINFIDTAEMYAVPPRKETYGRTEEIIGTWLASRGSREKVILATKVAGPGPRFAHVRDGDPRHDRRNIEAAVDASLRRLQTDYIDLYQLHWPDRSSNFFGRRGFEPNPDERMTPLDETVAVLEDIRKTGKIRHYGVSNETPWGLMTQLRIADTHGWARPVSIQNCYNLLNRSFEVGLAEVAVREDCGLLAYSPMAGGALSGKYLGGAKPAGARQTLFTMFTRYSNENGIAATERYVAIARKHGLDPGQMALAFVNDRPFVTANIIGATTIEQLKTDIESIDLTLSADVLAEIEAVQTSIPDPCP